MKRRLELRVFWVLCIFLSSIFLTFGWTPVEAKQKKQGLVDAITEMVKPVLVSPPEDQEVCFSPEEPCDIKLVKFVDSAEKSIDVAIYDINLDQLVHHLLVKSKKIPVRIVVDRRQAKGNHSLVSLLSKAGAAVRYGRQRGIMHNKFIIVDGKALETGSFNFTNHATQANNENQVYLWNPKIVGRYVKRFDEIWAKADPVVAQVNPEKAPSP